MDTLLIDTGIMYSFLETVNTMRLAKVTPEFIKTRIFDM